MEARLRQELQHLPQGEDQQEGQQEGQQEDENEDEEDEDEDEEDEDEGEIKDEKEEDEGGGLTAWESGSTPGRFCSTDCRNSGSFITCCAGEQVVR